MPLYDFKCPAGHVFETMVPVVEHHAVCPQCQAQATRQLAAPKGYQLKGGGFYETDFKTKNGS